MALAQLRNISYSPMQSRSSQGSAMDVSSSMEQETFGAELPQLLADGIGRLVQDKFAELMVGQEMYAKRKVLAGIVMTENGELENAKVISVSTGTKCINGEHISIIGVVVNDCHAEIISRRCLMVFLYSQLRLLFSEETKATSIFEECPDRPEVYQLRGGVEFHLYINTAPCGDARIFSPHDAENNNVDKHPNRKARGQLRTKIESGEGTIPAKNNSGLQTWDGVIQGQRLLTMSCSDKIAKWNVMGIQGSLLASLVKPIYLSSIVLGSLLHPAHMYRAVCGRIEAAVASGLPSPYYLNRPKLALVTSAEHRNQLKAPNFSVNWSYGDSEVEIINSVTGKTIHSQVSRISKQMFIVRYMNAAQHLKSQPPKLDSDYGELKAAVKEYQVRGGMVEIVG